MKTSTKLFILALIAGTIAVASQVYVSVFVQPDQNNQWSKLQNFANTTSYVTIPFVEISLGLLVVSLVMGLRKK